LNLDCLKRVDQRNPINSQHDGYCGSGKDGTVLTQMAAGIGTLKSIGSGSLFHAIAMMMVHIAAGKIRIAVWILIFDIDPSGRGLRIPAVVHNDWALPSRRLVSAVLARPRFAC
jgi:hypothetical protein